MTLTFAGVLFSIVVVVVLATLAETLSRYGARVLALGDELAGCRDSFEVRLAMRPVSTPRATIAAIPRPAPVRACVAHRAAA